jgi:hypothetical protein
VRESWNMIKAGSSMSHRFANIDHWSLVTDLLISSCGRLHWQTWRRPVIQRQKRQNRCGRCGGESQPLGGAEGRSRQRSFGGSRFPPVKLQPFLFHENPISKFKPPECQGCQNIKASIGTVTINHYQIDTGYRLGPDTALTNSRVVASELANVSKQNCRHSSTSSKVFGAASGNDFFKLKTVARLSPSCLASSPAVDRFIGFKSEKSRAVFA